MPTLPWQTHLSFGLDEFPLRMKGVKSLGLFKYWNVFISFFQKLLNISMVNGERFRTYLYKYAAIPKIIIKRIMSKQKLRLDLSWNKIRLRMLGKYKSKSWDEMLNPITYRVAYLGYGFLESYVSIFKVGICPVNLK